MRFQPLFFIVLIAVSLPISVCAQTVEFQLEQNIKKHHKNKVGKGVKTEVKTAEDKVTVILEPEAILVRLESYEKIYNFKQNTLTLINHDKQQRTGVSLYAIPAFKSSEKRNRQVLSEALRNSGIIQSLTNPFELDMMFGGNVDEELAQKIEHKKQNDSHTFYYEGDEVAAYRLSEQSIPSELQDLYKKYLIYEHNVHPVIVEQLVEERKLFHSLSYRNKQEIPYLMERSYTLSSFKSHSRHVISVPESYQENYAVDKNLNRVIKLSKTEEEKTVDDYASEMNILLDRDKYLEASFLFHEYSIHHGVKGIDKIKPVVRRIFGQSSPDSDVKRLAVAIAKQPSSKEDIQKAVKIIKDIRNKAASHRYVLNVFLANYYDALGNNKKAIDLILKALEQNPFLTGAYKDLGDKYFRIFEIQNAWSCWDQMRKVNPDHQLVPAVRNLERQIEQKHPEYFR